MGVHRNVDTDICNICINEDITFIYQRRVITNRIHAVIIRYQYIR
jgi:hypothetical protein